MRAGPVRKHLCFSVCFITLFFLPFLSLGEAQSEELLSEEIDRTPPLVAIQLIADQDLQIAPDGSLYFVAPVDVMATVSAFDEVDGVLDQEAFASGRGEAKRCDGTLVNHSSPFAQDEEVAPGLFRVASTPGTYSLSSSVSDRSGNVGFATQHFEVRSHALRELHGALSELTCVDGSLSGEFILANYGKEAITLLTKSVVIRLLNHSGRPSFVPGFLPIGEPTDQDGNNIARFSFSTEFDGDECPTGISVLGRGWSAGQEVDLEATFHAVSESGQDEVFEHLESLVCAGDRCELLEDHDYSNGVACVWYRTDDDDEFEDNESGFGNFQGNGVSGGYSYLVGSSGYSTSGGTALLQANAFGYVRRARTWEWFQGAIDFAVGGNNTTIRRGQTWELIDPFPDDSATCCKECRFEADSRSIISSSGSLEGRASARIKGSVGSSGPGGCATSARMEVRGATKKVVNATWKVGGEIGAKKIPGKISIELNGELVEYEDDTWSETTGVSVEDDCKSPPVSDEPFARPPYGLCGFSYSNAATLHTLDVTAHAPPSSEVRASMNGSSTINIQKFVRQRRDVDGNKDDCIDERGAREDSYQELFQAKSSCFSVSYIDSNERREP